MPEVHGAPEQRCPHCSVLIGAPRVTTGELLAGGFRELAAQPRKWWGAFLGPAIFVDLATALAALTNPSAGTFLTSCGAAPAVRDVAFYATVTLLILATFGAYFIGWASVSAAHADVARNSAWWRNALLGTALLTALYAVGFVLLFVGALFVFIAALLAPVALGRGRGPAASLDAAREANRRRPTGFVLVALLFVLLAELVLAAASCVPGFALSLAVQGLVWWALAPIVPVLTSHAYARLERA